MTAGKVKEEKTVIDLQCALQWITEVFCDFVHANAAHSADSQSPDKWVWVLRVLKQETSSESIAATACV